jgi:hypothetical protein
VAVFSILMLALGAIFAGFYYSQYAGSLNDTSDRLNSVTAALEFAVLEAGPFCMLLRVRPDRHLGVR